MESDCLNAISLLKNYKNICTNLDRVLISISKYLPPNCTGINFFNREANGVTNNLSKLVLKSNISDAWKRKLYSVVCTALLAEVTFSFNCN